MTSDRKIAANRQNATRSAGPRTQGGKIRASSNAFRHGLAVSVRSDSTLVARMTQLTRSMAGGLKAPVLEERVRSAAEASFELQRVRVARGALIGQGVDLSRALASG